MPLKSKAQQRYLFAKARKDDMTSPGSDLPDRVNPKGTVKNKPVTKAFKPGAKKKLPSALSSYGEDSLA